MNKKPVSEIDQYVLTMVEKQFSGIEIQQFFNDGSTARVYHVLYPLGPDLTCKVDRIIKVFRYTEELSEQINPNEVCRAEFEKLISVNHNNVVSVYDWGYLEDSGEETLPYFIMEYLPNAQDFDKWLEKSRDTINREHVIDLLIQAAHGLHALHSNNIIHCDLKFGNMLVGETGRLEIADLGFSKYISGKPGTTGLYTSHKYFPTCYRDFENSFQDKRQMYTEIPRKHIKESFDLHYFGRIIKDILAFSLVAERFSPSDQKRLGLTIERLDLDCSEERLPKYKSALEMISDLEKMKASYTYRSGVKELSSYTGTSTVRVPVSGSIPFTKRVATVIHHPTFFRLNNAQQLGFTYYVFPGACHTRLEHSLGVYYNVSRYLNSLLADDHQPYFRQLVTEEMISTALLAGLLHDIGQHSFAHSLEDIGLVQEHEIISEMFITGKGLKKFFSVNDEHKQPLIHTIKKYWPEANMKRLCWLVTGKNAGLPLDNGWEIIKAIINGPIDADKTDYLLRDALHAGVEYARSIDINRFMNSLTASLLPDKQYMKGVLAITWKGQQSAENIILARSQMFWVLYWHHAVRCAHAMLAHACASHLDATPDYDEKIRLNDILYWGTMGEFITHLQASESKRARDLASWLRIRRLFKRGIELAYEDDTILYHALLEKKKQYEALGDRLLIELSRKIAKEINSSLELKGTARLSKNDIIVDIPKADKDKLGQIYVVQKGADVATPYHSQGLVGNKEDWQNRVRTIRIFVDPRIDIYSRDKIMLKGREILHKVT